MFKLIIRKSTVNKPELIVSTSHLLYLKLMEQHVLETNAGKQLSYAATDLLSTLMLKKRIVIYG
jgi:hypothetical protein